MKKKFLLIIILGVVLSVKSQEKISQHWMAFYQKASVTNYGSKKIRLSAKIKVKKDNAEAEAYLWLRSVKNDGTNGEFKTHTNNTGVAPSDWSNYTIEYVLEKDAKGLNFGAMVFNDGEFLFDNFKVEVQKNDGSWKKLNINNSNFEENVTKGKIPMWSLGMGGEEVLVREFTISSSNDTQDSNGLSLSLIGKGINITPGTEEFNEVYSETLNPYNETIVLKNINYIEIEKGVTKKASIIIKDGIIKTIKKEVKIPDESIVIDGSKKWLMPGLIDSHIHLFQSGGIYARPDAFDLTKYRPYKKERDWIKKNTPDILKRYLKAGITTVIDMGGPIYNLALRDSLTNPKQYANVFITGPLISTYQPKAFDIENPPIIKVDSISEAVKLVKEQLPYKPDFIKIWYIANDQKEAEDNFELVKATITESHSHNLKVAVHATQLHTAKLAVKAGADILVHSIDNPVDDEFISLLKKNKVSYIPTLIVGRKYLESYAQQHNFTDADFKIANPHTLGTLQDLHHLNYDNRIKAYRSYGIETLKNPIEDEAINNANLKILYKAGINIATGTDAGNIGTLHASSYFEELENMKLAGLTNKEILKISTLNAAKVLGKQDEIGSIAENKIADLILLNKNPIEDLRALEDISHVIKGGQVFEADKVIFDTPEQLVQRQLNAYNAGNIDAFLAPYSEDLELYTFPDTLNDKGKETIRSRYEDLFEKYPKLHCELIKRIVKGNTVIDHERITLTEKSTPYDAIAVYKIKNGKIEKVYFVRD